jgi:ammonium transporter, Amt family
MTISVGFLEVGELGERLGRSLMKTLIITSVALVLMAVIGFNTAFAPTIGGGLIGNPTYAPGLFLGGFSSNPTALTTNVWWSMGPNYFNTGLYLGTYFLFETAFAAVTLALVGVVVLSKMKLRAFTLFMIPYFILIWNLPAAWIWNPTGWLAKMGMADFAGGLVVHGAAGAAGLALLIQIWREEKARGLKESQVIPLNINPGWLTLSILLLWVGWFGFNPGSVLAFNTEALTVVLTTFLAASTAFCSLMACTFLMTRKDPGFAIAGNGVLMGLIVITPLAGYVSPASAILLGILCGPLFLAGEWFFAKQKWLSDPVGLLPGHLVGGLFGVLMIPFFTQTVFASASGAPGLPNGLLFGGGMSALHQLGVEAFGIVVVFVTVFVLSLVCIWVIAQALGGITRPLDAGTKPPVSPNEVDIGGTSTAL